MLCSLEISYNGKTSTLQTASDIAAWIAERKKRFPTKARIAERSSRNQHTNKPGGSKSKLPPRHDGEANPNARAIKRQKIESDRADKNRKDKGEEAGDALSKARSRMEKLRRQMAREEDRISKIAAKASSGKERETRNDSKEKTVCSRFSVLNVTSEYLSFSEPPSRGSTAETIDLVRTRTVCGHFEERDRWCRKSWLKHCRRRYVAVRVRWNFNRIGRYDLFKWH